MTNCIYLAPLIASVVLAGCHSKLEPNGTCVRLADGVVFQAKDGMIRQWERGWVYWDANGISHWVGAQNSDQFKCTGGS